MITQIHVTELCKSASQLIPYRFLCYAYLDALWRVRDPIQLEKWKRSR